MAQSLELNIRTTSDVPQAMDKAKAATSSFDKQVGDIGKKFGTSFKDIFLSFLGPMAILSTALGFIGKIIADNQKKQQEANQAAIDGTNNLMSAQDNYYANKRANEKKSAEDEEQANKQRIQTTTNFLNEDLRGRQVLADYMSRKIGDKRTTEQGFPRRVYNAPLDKEVQDKIQAIIAADIKKDPGALTSTGPTSFRTPEGFGNVVGVGANPVIEAMTAQLEESRKQTVLLESLNNKSPGGGVPTDFTKQPAKSSSPLVR